MNEKWAITGSHGFLGEHLVSKLGGAYRMDRVPQNPKGIDIYADLASFGNMSNQTVYSEIYRANTMRVINQLERIEDTDYKAYLYVSTSSVTLPHQTYYSASKKATEEFIALYAREKNKAVVSIRPYSITGVREQSQHLIPKLIDSCLHGTKMDFVVDPVHDFLDVDDFTDALLLISQSAQNYKGRIFAVGSGKQYTNAQVLEIVEKVTGKKANVNVVKSMRAYDTIDWQADTTLMYSLGWQPKKSLEDSIREMVANA